MIGEVAIEDFVEDGAIVDAFIVALNDTIDFLFQVLPDPLVRQLLRDSQESLTALNSPKAAKPGLSLWFTHSGSLLMSGMNQVNCTARAPSSWKAVSYSIFQDLVLEARVYRRLQSLPQGRSPC